MLPAYSTLATAVADSVLTVTLNRPEARNALNTQMGRDLGDLWTRLIADAGEIRVVVLTGAGSAFCAGGDLKERDGMTDLDWQRQHEIFERAFWSEMECPIPIIAAVNGHAFGGGLEFVLAADFAYGARGAKFALTEVSLGIMPGGGGTQNLPRAVGERRAKELILSAKPFTAEEAAAWGVLNRVCEGGELMKEAMETARAIATNAPLSVRQAKRSIHYGLQSDIATGLRFEIEAYNRLVPTEDRREGVRAFNEKRKPVYRGR
ncbi:MAG TPA: enoyl-CoA hydratase-related protein [Alphaproteobacteria bacterium]|nr:enoyl-CoA hydratase-related protein [Alphaproteobacteria bacterium]